MNKLLLMYLYCIYDNRFSRSIDNITISNTKIVELTCIFNIFIIFESIEPTRGLNLPSHRSFSSSNFYDPPHIFLSLRIISYITDAIVSSITRAFLQVLRVIFIFIIFEK